MPHKNYPQFSTRWAWFIFTILVINVVYQCKDVPSEQDLQILFQQKVVLLDSTRAAKAVTTDRQEDFFNKIKELDMSLQMQRTYPSNTPRDSVLQDYQRFLAEDVLNFEPHEEVLLKRILADIHVLCNKIAPNIFPESIELVKTRSRYYGNSVYYTRDNRIIIPTNELQSPNESALRAVLTHEVFHIFSRLNPEKRAELYELIGFQKLDAPLVMPSVVESRLLLNPDGVDIAYTIQLRQPGGDSLRAVPLITANAPAFLSERKSYFEYINFNLYPVEKQPVGNYLVVALPEGISPLRLAEQVSFHQQITDNTQYIIHPDEILADNFSYLILSKSEDKNQNLDRFSQEGQALLKKIEAVLKQ